MGGVDAQPGDIVEAKDALEARVHEQLARVGKAFASPRRIEVLQLLGQGERSVEALARAIRSGLANTSGHLQVLRQAGLVETRREGTKIFYRLADDDVARFLLVLGDLARHRLAEVERLLASYLDEGEIVSASEDLLRLREEGKVTLLDVRPSVEYEAGHIPGALSIPLEELLARVDELPRERELVVYCRGGYSSLSAEAVRLIGEAGLNSERLDVGFLEWRLRGLPIEASSQEAEGTLGRTVGA